MSGCLRTSKSLYRVTLCLTLCLLVSACGETSRSTSISLTPTVAATSFPVPINPKIAALPPFTLNIWFADDYYSQGPIVDLMKEFKQAYPNITIAVDHNEWSKLRNKLKEAVAAGNPPDVA